MTKKGRPEGYVSIHVAVPPEVHKAWMEVCEDEGCSLGALICSLDPHKIPQRVLKQARRTTHQRRMNSNRGKAMQVIQARQLAERLKREGQ